MGDFLHFCKTQNNAAKFLQQLLIISFCTALKNHSFLLFAAPPDSYYANALMSLEFSPVQHICICRTALRSGLFLDDELDLASIVPAIIRSDKSGLGRAIKHRLANQGSS